MLTNKQISARRQRRNHRRMLTMFLLRFCRSKKGLLEKAEN
jgi:hypothetical protein